VKNFSFNPVDGFIYGLNFRISKSWKTSNSFSLYPDIRWAFSREQVMWRVNANYKFNGLKQRQLFIKTGITSKDISNGGGNNIFLNTATSLFLKENYIKLYESGYLTLGYSSEIVNGLTLELSAGYEDRRVLQNTSDFSFFRSSKEYSDNTPVNIYLAPGSNPDNALHDQKHADFVTKVTYTPLQKYRINKGNKIPVGSDWPTFNLTWQHGINEISEMRDKSVHYNMMRFEVYKSRSIGAFSYLRCGIAVAFRLVAMVTQTTPQSESPADLRSVHDVESPRALRPLGDQSDRFHLPGGQSHRRAQRSRHAQYSLQDFAKRWASSPITPG